MRAFLVLTTIITVILAIIILNLMLKMRILAKKIKYVDEADKWHKMAVTDELTGIYNRNAFNLYIDRKGEEAKTEKRWIILFDIDNFKIINDTKGHLEGDIVLKKVAQSISEVFSDIQYKVFRIGGDEFSVLAESVSEKEIIELLIELKKRLEEGENISLSKGYSDIKGNFDESFKNADVMLYADKLSKKLRSFQAE